MYDHTDDLRRILGVLSRRARLIVLALAGTLGLAAATLLVLTPIYAATTLVLYEPGSRDLLEPGTTFAVGPTENARVDSEAELLRSDAVLLRVVDAMALADDPEFAPKPAWFDSLGGELPPDQLRARTLDNFRDALTIERRGLTYLLSVEARSVRPERAAELANAVADAYIADQLERKVSAVLDARALVARRLGAYAVVAPSLPGFARQADDLAMRAELQLPDSRVVSPALPAYRPAFPDPVLVLALAAILGLGLGGGLALAAENLLGGVVTDDQLRSALGISTGAVLPRAGSGVRGQAPSDLVSSQPLSPYAEAVRRLRASAGIALQGETSIFGRVLMVTSSTPGEGKSTTALSLARDYARAGQRTLLIDCDLRSPGLLRHAAGQRMHGLLDLLEGKGVGIADIAVPDDQSDLTVLIGAAQSAQGTEHAVASRNFALLLDAARRTYDVVILDTPPTAAAVDALYIAPHADLIVLVTHWAVTTQRDVRAAVRSLREATAGRVPLLAVLNQWESHPSPMHRQPRYVPALS